MLAASVLPHAARPTPLGGAAAASPRCALRRPAPGARGAGLVAGASHQIFANSTTTRDVTLEDVRQARCCCDCLEGNNRADCYTSYGINVDTVDQYYDIVSTMEDCLGETEDLEPALDRFARYVLNVLRALMHLIAAAFGLLGSIVLPIGHTLFTEVEPVLRKNNTTTRT